MKAILFLLTMGPFVTIGRLHFWYTPGIVFSIGYALDFSWAATLASAYIAMVLHGALWLFCTHAGRSLISNWYADLEFKEFLENTPPDQWQQEMDQQFLGMEKWEVVKAIENAQAGLLASDFGQDTKRGMLECQYEVAARYLTEEELISLKNKAGFKP